MDMTIGGLAWLLAGLGTAAVGVIGALVQLAVLVLRAPGGQRRAYAVAAVSGPLAATTLALALALSIDQFGREAKATLDQIWIAIPLVACALWFYLNRWLIRRLPQRDTE